ncbi:hypothetical protein [Streptomyces sp. NBC_00162]|uniref:hypothetical protein n=1 Tax=Streptomyces sp. NBC_00162 TaxID=2903629 RepID=UPI00214A8B9E|nr:hypothetical protein [Streptomyces sp. NBC_00162]UUU38099.1 hypothetical protein JIW86_04035 [Streptomyces sp. NBC_00162]
MPSSFSAPGFADELTPGVLDRWNQVVEDEFKRLEPLYGSPYFTLEPGDPNPQRVAVTWFGNPAEPEFCFDETTARRLSDWGVRGRRALHNEYCEYAVVTAPDQQGNLRPKRVQVTTELPEYYQLLAEDAPDLLRDILSDTLGGEPPRWEEIYGPAVANPKLLSPAQRRVAFARQMTGHGLHPDLQEADVPADPVGSLNAVNALFMAHPINGLDDLLYIVMFGAKPYARRTASGALEAAGRDQIFRQDPPLAALACRNADPAAAMAAAGAAFDGRTVSFADPIGMYIHAFTSEVFQFEGGPVPDPWIRLSRGRQGLHQRLEFGPGDADPHFLDDITVAEGESEDPLTGGYQVVRHVQVGPLAALGAPKDVPPGDFVVLPDPPGPIRCRDAVVCSDVVRPLKEAFEAAAGQPAPPAGPRGRR